MRAQLQTLACVISVLGLLAACGDSTGTGAGSGGGDSGGGSTTDATTTSGSTTGAGGSAATINGCTLAAADDSTGMAAVSITWSSPHQACTRVDVGTAVTWNGDFGFHPLVGGEPPTTDATSPITGNTPAGNMTTVTFATAGTYPYFCDIHNGTLQGVIYVE